MDQTFVRHALGESIDFAKAVAPRVAIPMHEAGLAHTGRAHAMLRAFLPATIGVSPLRPGVKTEI